MKRGFYYETVIGRIGIAEDDGAVTNVFFGHTVAPEAFEVVGTPLLDRAAEEIDEYLQGAREAFDLPVRAEGTAFEQAVWAALTTIPYGQTRTYGEIAAQIGRPGASRAVGRANGRNPVSIVIPCHRVVGASGAMTGYAGGVELKLRLLALEGAR